jgi:hypothetical protein
VIRLATTVTVRCAKCRNGDHAAPAMAIVQPNWLGTGLVAVLRPLRLGNRPPAGAPSPKGQRRWVTDELAVLLPDGTRVVGPGPGQVLALTCRACRRRHTVSPAALLAAAASSGRRTIYL